MPSGLVVNIFGEQTIELPDTVPVMVLPTVLFPHSLLPLHIFEPRYRAMLDAALSDERMFCIALLRRGVQEWKSPGDFHEIAGLGLVRACVGRPDGTSDLILQGLVRVKFVGFDTRSPFPIAEIEALTSIPAATHDAPPLIAKLLGLCARLREHGHSVPQAVDDQLARIENPDLLSDIVAHTFLRDPFRRQDVLEELRVGERLRLLIRHLSTEMVLSEES